MQKRKDKRAQEQPQTQEATQTDTADIDALMEEIDGVLETNSEEFVKGFVQKGGE